MNNNKVLSDSRHNIILFLTVFILYAFVYMTKQCFNAAMADIVNEGFMTKSQTGLIVAVFYVIYAPMQLVGGIAADKFDNEKLIRMGLIGGGIANAVIFFNHSYTVMLLAWSFNALVQFALWPSVLKIISSRLNKEHRSKAVLYISMAAPLGTVFAYLTAILISKWQYNFAISSLILFALAILFYFIYKYMKNNMTEEKTEIQQKHDVQENGKKLSAKAIIFASGLIFLFFMSVIREMLGSGAKAFAPVMLMESYDRITPAIGNLMNIIIIFFGVGGVFAARIIYPRYIKSEHRAMCAIFLAAVPAAALLVFLGRINIVVCVFALAWLSGLMTAAAVLTTQWTVKFHKYGCVGAVAGIINSAASFGIVFESYGFAKIADKIGWTAVTGVWVVMLGICITLVVSASFCWKRFCANESKNGEEHL